MNSTITDEDGKRFYMIYSNIHSGVVCCSWVNVWHRSNSIGYGNLSEAGTFSYEDGKRIRDLDPSASCLVQIGSREFCQLVMQTKMDEMAWSYIKANNNLQIVRDQLKMRVVELNQKIKEKI